MSTKKVFLTDGDGIFKLVKPIKAVVLKNLETGELTTAEAIGNSVEGFAIIGMPKVMTELVSEPAIKDKLVPKLKQKKIRKGKTSQYYGVSLNSKATTAKRWRTFAWLEGRNVSFGNFETELEAARVVDEELVKRGLPKRNFP